ncbi:MAG: hypothetical protein EXR72_01010 [Myxococcales bacterium]|nr:hypothetical protein [Myxococcales bacterium]
MQKAVRRRRSSPGLGLGYLATAHYPNRLLALLAVLAILGGCGPAGRGTSDGGGGGERDLAEAVDLAMAGMPADLWVKPVQEGCGELMGCYTVYAHADHVLYRIDLEKKLLIEIGPFNAPMVKDNAGKMVEDTLTDLAVAPDDTIYAISRASLYKASPKDGHVTLVGPVTACGTFAVAMTFTPDGLLYAGDFKGAFCKIDLTMKPPKVTQISATLGGNLALTGDLVAVADGTMFGTAYDLKDAANVGTQADNLLVRIDPATGKATRLPMPTGFPKMFGTAFALGKVFGFTHDGTGQVVVIDPKTGKGTLYATFTDPKTMMGIYFAGAGVNSKVEATIP